MLELDQILRCDSKEEASELSEKLYDEECIQKNCPIPKEQRVTGTRFKYAVYENIFTSEFGLHVPKEDLTELGAEYITQIKTPLWIDEKFINGQPFCAFGNLPFGFGFGIIQPESIRKTLEGNFTPQLLQEVRNGIRKYTVDAQKKIKSIIDKITQNPQCIDGISPNEFEEIVAELLKDNGFDTYLTPRTRDGGRDIIAAYSLSGKIQLVIVECKKYNRSKTLGPVDVRALVGVFNIEQENHYHSALLVTTAGTVGPEAIKIQEKVSKLHITNYDEFQSLLTCYGQKSKSGLWMPERFL